MPLNNAVLTLLIFNGQDFSAGDGWRVAYDGSRVAGDGQRVVGQAVKN